jgi:glycopeptide antibiotics resistance protein
LIITTVASSLFAVAIELLQINGTISGTFDILDIITELVVIFLAIIIIKSFETKNK